METQTLFPSASGIFVYRGLSASLICNLLFVTFILSSRDTEGVQVTGGKANVAQGETALLPCKLTDTKESLTQISWQRKTRGKPQTDNFYTISEANGAKFVNGGDERFKFVGSITDLDGSIKLSDVTMMDEGVYTCIFTLFPSGNHKTEIPLNLLVPAVTSLKDNHPTLDNEKEVSLGTCTAAGSRPPAEVKWETGTLGDKVRATTNSTLHDNGTTTTVSTLFGVPTKEINQHLVNCVITSVDLKKNETLPFTIQVYFSPMEVTVNGTSPSSFQCVTEANPPASFTWSRSGGLWPESAVRTEGATLQFLSMTSDLNGEYQCEASNTYGRNHGRLYLHVPEGTCTHAWILFILSLLLNVFGAAAVWYLYQSGKFLRTKERHAIPTTLNGSEGDQADMELEE